MSVLVGVKVALIAVVQAALRVVGPARACADTDMMKAPLFVAMFAGMASQL